MEGPARVQPWEAPLIEDLAELRAENRGVGARVERPPRVLAPGSSLPTRRATCESGAASAS